MALPGRGGRGGVGTRGREEARERKGCLQGERREPGARGTGGAEPRAGPPSPSPTPPGAPAPPSPAGAGTYRPRARRGSPCTAGAEAAFMSNHRLYLLRLRPRPLLPRRRRRRRHYRSADTQPRSLTLNTNSLLRGGEGTREGGEGETRRGARNCKFSKEMGGGPPAGRRGSLGSGWLGCTPPGEKKISTPPPPRKKKKKIQTKFHRAPHFPSERQLQSEA